MFSEADFGSSDPCCGAFSVATPGVYFREEVNSLKFWFRFRFAIRVSLHWTVAADEGESTVTLCG